MNRMIRSAEILTNTVKEHMQLLPVRDGRDE
jgi:hypothetical protein